MRAAATAAGRWGRWGRRGRTGRRAIAATLALVAGGLASTVTSVTPAAAAPSVYPGLGIGQVLAFGSPGGVPAQVVTVAFDPTPGSTMIYAADKIGRVLRYDGPGDTTPTVTLDIRGEVQDSLDRGLVGIALDPDFATPASRYVYITYTYDKDPFGTDPYGPSGVPAWGGSTGNDSCGGGQNAVFGGCTVSSRLTRFHVSSAGVADGPEQVLVGNSPDSGFCEQFLSHSIGSVVFGPDGYLYVSAGDGASFSTVDWGQLVTRPEGIVNPCNDAPGYRNGAMTQPTAEGGVLRAQAVRTTYPADGYTPLDGTIMRINKDGSIPATNPLVANGITGDDRIVAFGLRNAFRFAFRPSGPTAGELFVGHVGNGTWESIDRFYPATGPVPNFGWPCYEGAHTDVSNMSAFNLCTSLTAAPEAIGTTSSAVQLRLPWFEYQHQVATDTDKGCKGTGSGSSIIGGTFVTATSWPIELQGQYVFGDYGQACLWAIDPDGATPARHWIASGLNPTQVVTGSDGNVYVVDLNPDTGANQLWRLGAGPTPAITVTPGVTVMPGALVTFSGAGTTFVGSPAGATYSWDLDGDGAYGDAFGVSTSRSYSALGPVRVGLKVTDAAGNVGYTSVVVQVGAPPTIATLDTSAGGGWSVGDRIDYAATATDAYGTTLHYRWDVAARHCDPSATTSDCHEHINVIGALPDAPSGSFTAPDHEWQAYLRIRLTVTDAYGLSTTRDAIVPALGVPISLATRPAGLHAAIGEVVGATPLSAMRVQRSNVQVALGKVQSAGGRPEYFTGWEDDPLAPADRAFVAAGPMSLTADFAAAERFTPVGPSRLLDTRDGTGGVTGKVADDGTVVLAVAGHGGVPADASGVVLNLTATESDRAAYVTAYPCDGQRPFASSLNIVPGHDVANLAQVRLAADGTVCLFAHASTHLVADIAGFFSAGGATFIPHQPERVLDTREGLGAPPLPVGPGAAITLDLSSKVPASATAVVLNLTATDVTGNGFVTAYPCGALPTVSNLNVPAGDTRANLTVVPLGPGATVCLYAQSRVSLVADLAGWYGAGGGRSVITQQPRRVMDTRESIGGSPRLAPRTPITLDLAPYAPPGASAVVLNLTSVGPDGDGFVAAYPCGSLPTVSNLNVPSGDTSPNLVMVSLSSATAVCLYSQSATDLVVDLAGWSL